tara:strand:- start:4560 stop:5285 length:726 start_codon:yes stop_codon:yes gene_type:complete
MQTITLLAIGFIDFFYQKKIIKFLKKKKFNKINMFFDVGAHKGESINLFLKNFKVKKIVSFEASKINYKYLLNKEKILKKKFKDSEICIENIALGAKNKKVFFKQFEESSSSTIKEINKKSEYYKRKFMLLNLWGNKKIYQKFKINIQKLSDYLKKKKIKKIDFLKIDTEGYEYEILTGLGKKISCVNTLMFEHHYDSMIKKNYTFNDINKLLLKNNFKLIYKSKMPFRKTFEYIYKKKER